MLSSASFAAGVVDAFGFLLASGFTLVSASEELVRFGSDAVAVAVVRDARLGEIDVFFVPAWDSERRRRYSIADVLTLEGIDADREHVPFQVYAIGRARPFVEKLASWVRMHGQAALAGDRDYYERLDVVVVVAAAEALTRDVHLRHVRSEVELAWQRRDLDAVVSLLESIGTSLSPAEARRLAYARGHRRSGPA